MKKLSIMCSVILALALVTAPAFAQLAYRIDILEAGNPGGVAGLKTFDDPVGLDVLAAGSYSMDVWLTGVGGVAPPNPTAGGAFVPIGAGVTIDDVKRYNGDVGELPGPWQAGAGSDSPPPGTPSPATCVIAVANLAGAAPDGAGDVIIARVDFTCTAATKVAVAALTIPSVPTWGPNPPYVDAAIIPAVADICQVETCTVDSDCTGYGDPCAPVTCETLTGGYCGFTGNTCQVGTPPACDDGVGCTDDTCTTGVGCVYTANDSNCPADTFCADNYCDSSLDCQVTYSTAECRAATNQCDAAEFCTGSSSDCPADVNQPNGTPCDDGVYCTASDMCMGGTCVGSGDPCDDTNTCTDDTCNEGTSDCTNACNAVSAVDDCCSDLACATTPICQAGGSISIGSFWANCGDVGIKIKLCLQNLESPIGGLQIDLCEEGHDTTNCLICVECELTERTAMFDCVVNELPNGCCRVILFAKHPGGLINPGECDIVTVVYELSDDPACCDTCITIDGEGIVLSDEYGYDILGVIASTGEVCPYVCGDVYPPESSPGAGDCGDAVIDIFDILEEVDIALNDDADACQAGPRSDVPTGTPPYCIDPDGVVNILDVMVIIDMVLDRQDCCSYWYAGIIY